MINRRGVILDYDNTRLLAFLVTCRNVVLALLLQVIIFSDAGRIFLERVKTTFTTFFLM